MFTNKDLISKVNFFNLGSNSPKFVLAISKNLYPKVYLETELIIRAGEYAEEFYFIKQGMVEMIATDGKTVFIYIYKFLLSA